MSHQVRILKGSTLLDIEEFTQTLLDSKAPELTVWLPRRLGSQLFKESRVVTLLATAASLGRLVVKDWIQKQVWDSRQAEVRFETAIEGLASVAYAHRISNATGENVDLSLTRLSQAVIENGGIVEGPIGHIAEVSSAKSFTICALDDQAPEPLVLGGIHSKEKFVKEFIELRDKYLEQAFGTGSSTSSQGSTDRALAGFIFELFQNSFEHGRLDENGQIIKGLRYVRLKKHIHYNQNDFLKRAEGFPELQNYISCIGATCKKPIFYEISISDHGMGLIRRFLHTRTEFSLREETPEARVELINRIIDKALSSKVNHPGAGFGLRRAIKAVRDLRGFISLRTNSVWLYKEFGQQPSNESDSSLLPVQSRELPSIAGTHFNMLFPLNR